MLGGQDERGISPEILLTAYRLGLFPMADARDDATIHWIEPKRRGIIPLDRFHVPKSLQKTIRQNRFAVTVDQDFEKVILACAEETTTRASTWLNDQLIELYIQLFERGHAHSVETRQDGRLVGGLYGVSLNGAFFGESMFSRASDASKVALVDLVARLGRGGFVLLDTQFVTDHLARFGAVEISRTDYRRRLEQALSVRATFPTDPSAQPGGAGTAKGGGSATGNGSTQPVSQTS